MKIYTKAKIGAGAKPFSAARIMKLMSWNTFRKCFCISVLNGESNNATDTYSISLASGGQALVLDNDVEKIALKISAFASFKFEKMEAARNIASTTGDQND